MQSRRASREAAIGLIYELEFHDPADEPAQILETARETRGIGEDDGYAAACFLGVCGNLPAIDTQIDLYSQGWHRDRISPVVLAVLRLSVYEMLFLPEPLPYSIAIDEAVELSKAYAEDGAAPFVNGILNSVAKANNCKA